MNGSDLTGTLIGSKYTILKLLGEGGFGRTHLAEYNGMKVVLKESWPDVQDRFAVQSREVLRLEADCLKDIVANEHLPALLDFIPGLNQQWLVLEFIDGRLVSDMLATMSAQLGTEQHLRTVGQWAIELATTLSFLHTLTPNHIVHCDVNPGNVMIRNNGKLALIDFGIARFLKADGSLVDKDFTKNLGTVGYPGFVAPEIQSLRITPQLDIYAAGVMLNWWMTGDEPVNDLDKAFERLPEIAVRGDQLWDGLAKISERARAFRSADRYNSAAEMETELRNLLTEPDELGEKPFPCEVCRLSLRLSQRFCPRCGQVVKGSTAVANVVKISHGSGHDEVLRQIESSIKENRFATFRRFDVFRQLRQAQQDPGFGKLISLPYLPRVEKLDHQIQAAKRALGEMKGFCLLADEVGLGKTIEAGIIIKELVLRNLVRRILIVASTSQMALQWQQELYEKFEIYFPVFGKDVDYSLAWKCDRAITSYKITQNRLHRTIIEQSPYDLVIMDEAHHLISSDAFDQRQSRILTTFAERVGAAAKYFLMLSATPFHNDLKELHTLLWLLKPGAVEDYPKFAERYMNPDDPYKPHNVEELKSKLSSVIIRNIRRKVTHLKFPRRKASDHPIEVPPEHKKLFNQFRQFVKDSIWNLAVNSMANEKTFNKDFSLGLQRVVESFHSSQGAYSKACEDFLANSKGLLRKATYTQLPQDLQSFGRQLNKALFEGKINMTYQILRASKGRCKFLIFTQYPDTAQMLYEKLAESGDLHIELYPTDEDLDGTTTMAVLDRFANRGDALICSENAAEGLNLQKSANSMINFDLPWDPMKLEQRIGRIQRLGQESPEIYIYNLFFVNTAEDDIYQVLKRKLELFEQTVGALEDIIGNMVGADQFELQMLDLFVNRGDLAKEIEIEDRFDKLAFGAREKIDQAGQLLNRFFGDDTDEQVPTVSDFKPVSLFRRCQRCSMPLEADQLCCFICGLEVDTDVTTQPASELDDDQEDSQPELQFETAAIFCDRCQSLLEAGSTYCESCQRTVVVERFDQVAPDEGFMPHGPRICANCQHSLEEDDLVCPLCGGEKLL